MSQDRRLVVGLGNPGDKYRYTRHNIAWLVLDAFADRVNWRGGGKRRDAAMVHAGRVLGLDLVMAKPDTFMNESGIAVRKLLAAERVPLTALLVVVDDFSLPFGTLRFREGERRRAQRPHLDYRRTRHRQVPTLARWYWRPARIRNGAPACAR